MLKEKWTKQITSSTGSRIGEGGKLRGRGSVYQAETSGINRDPEEERCPEEKTRLDGVEGIGDERQEKSERQTKTGTNIECEGFV